MSKNFDTQIALDQAVRICIARNGSTFSAQAIVDEATIFLSFLNGACGQAKQEPKAVYEANLGAHTIDRLPEK